MIAPALSPAARLDALRRSPRLIPAARRAPAALSLPLLEPLPELKVWERVATRAHQAAVAAHGRQAATLAQLRRCAQLLLSTTWSDAEHARAVAALAAGLTRGQASEWITKLPPIVERRRRARELARFAALLA